MKPTPIQYLNLLLDSFPERPVLTEKLQESLLRGLGIARKEDVYACSDTLLLGLIAARSVAVPVLDSADVNIVEYSKRLRADLLGYDVNTKSPFVEEYNNLRYSNDPGVATDIYRNLQIAGALANARGLPAIDTACFLQSIFCGSFNIDYRIDEEALQHLARTPVVSQLRAALSELGVDDPRITQMADITHKLRLYVPFIDSIFKHLSPYVPSLSAFESLENSIRFAKYVEPFLENTRLIFVPGSRRIHLRQFDYLNTYACRDENDLAGCKVNTCAGAGLITWKDIDAFESLINRGDVAEWDLQRFFEQHPAFLLGAQYHRLHSQVVLVSDDGQELIPDFFVERVGTTFADIIELKIPSAKLVSGSKNRKGFASALTRALNQVRVYRNYFDDAGRRRLFHQRYGFEAFRPAITVVIGRSSDYLDHMERVAIEDEYRNLQLLTYDDILLRAKQLAINI